ncbi:multifunctional expression regulator [Psittacid alphaherpesvirus 5]|uniref:Multifunctional expression regulator n=1 Tax=Psittacid alphaherpesvirus 5 TaxID=2972693 RepID=A0A5P9JQX8_9ALPH|nr:multifunctional expression regulator [Psittacid alphaherpesvirus 5]QFU14549.1 multifunctional expression regulator [Psittacid alphaherpesvirus 5]UOO01020.1 multifunctional expression regulator [Psittacid alphaherpesvirus 5]
MDWKERDDNSERFDNSDANGTPRKEPNVAEENTQIPNPSPQRGASVTPIVNRKSCDNHVRKSRSRTHVQKRLSSSIRIVSPQSNSQPVATNKSNRRRSTPRNYNTRNNIYRQPRETQQNSYNSVHFNKRTGGTPPRNRELTTGYAERSVREFRDVRTRQPRHKPSVNGWNRPWNRVLRVAHGKIWQDLDKPAIRCPSVPWASIVPKRNRELNQTRTFEKALTFFGGAYKIMSEDIERGSKRYLRNLASATAADDCDGDDEIGWRLTFPGFDGLPSSLFGTRASWTRVSDMCQTLYTRWNLSPSLTWLARITRTTAICNAHLKDLLEMCDETLTWAMWHEREDLQICPRDPIFANTHSLCITLQNRLGPALPCYLESVGSPLVNNSREGQSMESARCPLTFLLTFIDRFARYIQQHTDNYTLPISIIDPSRAMTTHYAPGMCTRKIPLILAQHANVCSNENCRVVCSQLISQQYHMGRFFYLDIFP